MDNKKRQQQIVKKCMEFMGKAEGVLECPICFNNSKQMVQCLTGHHVCNDCQQKLAVCPVCESDFWGTKSFLMEDLFDALSSIKLSLSDLEENAKKPVDTGIETYRKLIKTILFEFSSYCHKNNTFFLFLNKYLQDPTAHHSELEKVLIGLTSDLRNLTRIINDTEETLIMLKKKQFP